MKAIVLNKVGEPVDYQETKIVDINNNWKEVELKASAINHRDVWITKGQYAGIKLPCILGSDGAGVYNGKKVIIQPGIAWGDNENHQSRDYKILGMPDHGTMAQSVFVPEENIYDMPAHLDFTQAAAYGLAGLTAYRALMTKAKCSSTSHVLITGIGGGVALCALQIAVALGARVVVTSSSQEKIENALALGAVAGFNYRSAEEMDQLKIQNRSGFDIIIDSAGGAGFGDLVKLSAFGARIVLYGGSAGKWPQLSPQIIFWKQISILGSTMGSPADFKAWLDFINKHKLEPVIDRVYAMSEAQEAFDRVDKGMQMGKVVFNHEL